MIYTITADAATNAHTAPNVFATFGKCSKDTCCPHQDTKYQSHKSIERFVCRFYSAMSQYHSNYDCEDTDDQRYILSDLCLFLKLNLLTKFAAHPCSARAQSSLVESVDCAARCIDSLTESCYTTGKVQMQ